MLRPYPDLTLHSGCVHNRPEGECILLHSPSYKALHYTHTLPHKALHYTHTLPHAQPQTATLTKQPQSPPVTRTHSSSYAVPNPKP